MLGMPSFVTIDRSVHELFSENPRSPKTRKSVAIRDAVSDHSAMCRTYRFIDPGPSFVFIGPPPSATRPVAAGRRLARPPLPAIRDLDRPPPPQRPAGTPPPTTGRRSAGPASRCGGGGRQDTPVMASARRKTEVLTLGA